MALVRDVDEIVFRPPLPNIGNWTHLYADAANTACSQDGRCQVSDGKCAALSSADCRESLRCKLEGNCTAKDGKCIAASSADCAGSANCKTVNRCTAEDGVCVSSGQRAAGGGADKPSAKGGSTKLGDLFGGK